MDLRFRRLVTADIPTVIALTKEIWDGTDYMPDIIDRWIKHEENYTFGAFSDNDTRDLVGMAQVRWFSPETAWIEGGRVHPSLQKLGIGIQIASHALEYVRSRGGKSCLYDTSSQNHGSIALAKRFGFIERDRVRVSVLETQKAHFKHNPCPGKTLVFLPAKDAIAAISDVPNPPSSYISNGWSWAPLDEGYLARLPWRWARLGNAVALVMDTQPGIISEVPEPGTLWIIVHGDPADAGLMIMELLARNQETSEENSTSNEILASLAANNRERKGIMYHALFCPEPVAPVIEALGFHPYDKEPEWTVLFEKRF